MKSSSAVRPSLPAGPPLALHAVQVIAVALRARAGILEILTTATGGEPELPRTWVGRPASAEDTAVRLVAANVQPVAAHQVAFTIEPQPAARPAQGVVSCAVALLCPATSEPDIAWLPASHASLNRHDAAFVQQAKQVTRALLDDADEAVNLLDTPFTLGELRSIYEAFGDVLLDISAFNKRMLQPEGFLIPHSQRRTGHVGPPARTYTRGRGTAAWAGRLPARRLPSGN